MSQDHRSASCHCIDKNDMENHIESNSDLEHAPYTCGSITASKSLLESSIHEHYSEKSLVTKVLRDIDTERMNRISLQNIKLSLIFPEASLHIFSLTFSSDLFFEIYIK